MARSASGGDGTVGAATRDRTHIPTAQGAPVDLALTTVRGFPEYLVDLEVGPS
jgi:hypothetical protein